MDPKKDLTPELKQIYERVMNTQVKKPGETPTAGDPAAPASATPNIAQTPVSPIPPASEPVIPTPPLGVTPPPPPKPNLDQISSPPTTPVSTPPPPPTNNDFLSSVPPRPVTDTNTFVFTGNKVTTPQDKGKVAQTPQKNQTPTVGTSGKKISGKLIGALVVVLIVVWTVFWAKFFKLV